MPTWDMNGNHEEQASNNCAISADLSHDAGYKLLAIMRIISQAGTREGNQDLTRMVRCLASLYYRLSKFGKRMDFHLFLDNQDYQRGGWLDPATGAILRTSKAIKGKHGATLQGEALRVSEGATIAARAVMMLAAKRVLIRLGEEPLAQWVHASLADALSNTTARERYNNHIELIKRRKGIDTEIHNNV